MNAMNIQYNAELSPKYVPSKQSVSSQYVPLLSSSPLSLSFFGRQEDRKQLLSDRQENVLTAIINALFPSTNDPQKVSNDTLIIKNKINNNNIIINDNNLDANIFWEYPLSLDPIYRNEIDIAICNKITLSNSKQLKYLLNILSTSVGTSLIFGDFTLLKSFDKLTLLQQIQLLQSLEQSKNVIKRSIFQGLKRLLCGIAFTYYHNYNNIDMNRISNDHIEQFLEISSSVVTEKENLPTKTILSEKNKYKKIRKNTINEQNLYYNPFWKAMKYPGPPLLTQKHKTEKTNKIKDKIINSSILDLQNNITIDELEYDIIIIGSGASGCVAAYALSHETNLTILVIEAGSYIDTNKLTYLESNSMNDMYLQHGLLTTIDNNILILAGSTLGGGTTINWSCCLSLPNHILNEWNNIIQFNYTAMKENENKSDLVTFGKDYHEALYFIQKKIGVIRNYTNDCSNKMKSNPIIHHNKMNQAFVRGCNQKGCKYETTGQNLISTKDPNSGYICFGNRYGNKNDGIQSFLVEACQTKQVHILQNCKVQRLITENNNNLLMNNIFSSPKNVKAVECKLQTNGYSKSNRFITIRAKQSVILAAGALQTPCILQRSNFQSKHIGKHLHIHPVIVASGFTALSTPQSPVAKKSSSKTDFNMNKRIRSDDIIINCFLGAPMTTVCNDFQMGPTNDGYGCKLECPLAHPGLYGATLPWRSPQEYKQRLQRFNCVFPIIAFQRDYGEGTVHTSNNGELIVNYKVHEKDKHSLLQGMHGALEILIASGMKEVCTANVKDQGLRFDSITFQGANRTEAVNEYHKHVQDIGLKPFEAIVASAHQMSTCRMSSKPENGVVDVNGETWECNNLYIMDTSIFPTASGSNPMLTVLTLAYMLSKRLALSIKYQQTQKNNESYDFPVDLAKASILEHRRMVIRTQGFPIQAKKLSVILRHLLIRMLILFVLLLPSVWLFLIKM